MIKAGAIDKGMFLLIKNEPHLVAEREFVNPGKGSAFVRLKLKNLITGQVLKETMKTPDNVEEATVAEKNCQYLYADAEAYHFMDSIIENRLFLVVPSTGTTQHHMQGKHTMLLLFLIYGIKPELEKS